MDRIDTRPLELPPAIRGLNLFTSDRDLQRRLARRSPDLLPRHGDRLARFGAWVGDTVEAQADYTNRHAPPRLESHDGLGAATGRVVLNADYRDCHAEAYRRGIIGLAFGAEGERAPHLLSFVMGGVLSQADISLHCPVTMTGAVAWVLDRLAPDAVRSAWLPQLIQMDGLALSGGTWATELHGGTDVAATTTVAEPDGAAWRLTGLKWFTSNAGAGVALATARPRGAPEGARGLGCYLVPSTLPDGTPNRLHIRRLKDKIGTRGLATGETMLDGAWALEVAPPPHGLKAMLEALEYSRVHNAFSAAGLQRRAFLESLAWTSHRRVGGTLLRSTPMMRDALLDLAAVQEATAALAFEAAMAFEAPGEDPAVDGWRRTAVALAKYWTAAQATAAAAQAVEIVGGNGYTEEWPTARLYRDALVTAVWEGPANVQALEFLRAAIGKLPGDQAFLDRVGGILDSAPDSLSATVSRLRPVLDSCRAGFAHLRARLEEGPRLARKLMHPAAELLAAALMLEEATADLAAGDRRKALMAARFAHRFGAAAGPELAEDPLHAVFDDAIGYGVCPA
jgi:alkylation response protein AidB-like acyl-CoA dehydrogenase